VLGIRWVWEPVGPNTYHRLAQLRWLTALFLCAREALAGVVFGLGYKRPVARHHSLGSGGTRPVLAAAFECITCGEFVAALIQRVHRIGTVPNTDRFRIFLQPVFKTSDRRALLDAALLI